MKKSGSKNNKNYVPFKDLKAASEGDLEAIEKIVKHFEPFIRSRARGLYIRPDGEYEYVVDGQFHDEIVVQLIEAILKFRIRY